jgi:hypothetical protein
MNPRKDLVQLVSQVRKWGTRLALPALAAEMNTSVEKLHAMLDENEREWGILKRHLSLVRDMAETDSAMPADLDPLGKLAWRTIVEQMASLMAPEPVSKFWTGGCTSFYSPKRWRERGEQYGGTSLLIVVYDGGDLRPFFEPEDKFSSQRAADLQRALTSVGLYSEACTHWYSAIYVEDPDRARPFLTSEE